MTKRLRVIFAGIATCGIVIIAADALKSQPAANSDPEAANYWISVNADIASRDTKILDAIVRDALTNQALASTRRFYGGTNFATVRYTGFPTNYRPEVSGYRFELLPSSNLGSGLKLTLFFSGMWIDQPPPKDASNDFRMLRPERPAERGARLSFYNSGGPITNGNALIWTIGGCMIGYEIRQTSNGWNVGLSGQLDP